MSASLWIEDALVYAVLVGFVVMYAHGISRHLQSKLEPGVRKRVVSRFQKYSILLLTYITGVGVAHQIDLVTGVRAYVLLVVAALAFAVGLYALKRVMRSA